MGYLKIENLYKNQDKLKVLAIVKDICIEWVTENRLSNILSHAPYGDELSLNDIPCLIGLMIDDVLEEGKSELVDTPDLRRAIARETALMIKRRVCNVTKT